jgi:hypothetical protein
VAVKHKERDPEDAKGNRRWNGTPEEIIEKLRQLESAGLKQIMILPSLETQYGDLEAFARQVMARM